MNNHLNMLPKQAKFDLKCSKMRLGLRRSPRPPSRKGLRAFGARINIKSLLWQSEPPWVKSWLRACRSRLQKAKRYPQGDDNLSVAKLFN